MGLKLSDVSERAFILWLSETKILEFISNIRIVLDLFTIWSNEDGFSHECECPDRPDNLSVRQWLLRTVAWRTPGVLDLILGTNFPHYDRLIPNSWFSLLAWSNVDPQLLLEILQRDHRLSPALFWVQVRNSTPRFLLAY